jgi:type IV secretory pathway VirB10-like protein
MGRIAMKFVHLIGAICLTCSCGGWTLAQDSNPPGSSSTNPVLKHRPAESPKTPKPIIKEAIDLTVPKGTALQVVLDREIRVQKVGQPIHGHLIEPVYVFDKMVLPDGTEVTGQISQIESVSAGRRTLAALDANLTPARKITVEFTELSLADGKHIPIQTTVVPGSGQVIRFVTASESQKKKGVKGAVIEKERQAKEEARRQFDSAMQQVKEPSKLRRVERYAVAQLPVHPQYIDAGAMYFAELGKPLEFGSEPLTPETAVSMNSEIPEGTMVHARLTTPLNSASTQKGAEVEAVLSRPLVNDGKLILPQGSVLKGSVVQVRPARHWKHNGQLRFVFRDLVLPNGVESKVEAMVQGVLA